MLDAWEKIRAPRSVIAYSGNNMQKQKIKTAAMNRVPPFQTTNANIPVENNEDDWDNNGWK